MHTKFKRADELSFEVIGAAIEVHRVIGPGLIESIYETCLLHELGLRGIEVEQQRYVDIIFKDLVKQHDLRFDLLIEGCLLLELKACVTIPDVYKAKLYSYMKLLDAPIGLMMNFHVDQMTKGISRMILRGANLPETIGQSVSSGRDGTEGAK